MVSKMQGHIPDEYEKRSTREKRLKFYNAIFGKTKYERFTNSILTKEPVDLKFDG